MSWGTGLTRRFRRRPEGLGKPYKVSSGKRTKLDSYISNITLEAVGPTEAAGKIMRRPVYTYRPWEPHGPQPGQQHPGERRTRLRVQHEGSTELDVLLYVRVRGG